MARDECEAALVPAKRHREVRRTQQQNDHEAATERPPGSPTLGQPTEPLEPGTQRHSRGRDDGADHRGTVSPCASRRGTPTSWSAAPKPAEVRRPAAAQDLRDRRLQRGVSVADGELNAGQTALDQAPEELGPERFGLRFADIDRENLATPGLMHAVG